MSNFRRRFVYLVVDGGYNRRRRASLDNCFHMRRINMSRFFNPQSPPPPSSMDMVEDARQLPPPCMTFYAPSAMHFMLLGRDSKVLAVDHKGRAAIYDPASAAIRVAPALINPKRLPFVSVAVGDDGLYALDPTKSDEHSFEALVHKPRPPGDDDWHWQSLPPPPYQPYSCSFVGAYAAIGAYAFVGGEEAAMILVSTNNGATYSFDTTRRGWSKQGDWELPFRGLADYVPDYNLWFALNDAGHLCAFDLATANSSPAPPRPRNVWPELVKPPHKEWKPVTSYLVHLGSGRFCIARIFENKVKIPGGCCCCDMETQTETHAVFTGVEVAPCGKAGRGLRMVKHRSECYRLGHDILREWVL
uniref:F-box associated domain-containing protein n=1 Tax=Leersia perrieri TaxID=77586 RepID=A0A0D9W3N4_9ORYZ